ncbi:unnamed protein product, partial [Heterotrigona itama]
VIFPLEKVKRLVKEHYCPEPEPFRQFLSRYRERGSRGKGDTGKILIDPAGGGIVTPVKLSTMWKTTI